MSNACLMMSHHRIKLQHHHRSSFTVFYLPLNRCSLFYQLPRSSSSSPLGMHTFSLISHATSSSLTSSDTNWLEGATPIKNGKIEQHQGDEQNKTTFSHTYMCILIISLEFSVTKSLFDNLFQRKIKGVTLYVSVIVGSSTRGTHVPIIITIRQVCKMKQYCSQPFCRHSIKKEKTSKYFTFFFLFPSINKLCLYLFK